MTDFRTSKPYGTGSRDAVKGALCEYALLGTMLPLNVVVNLIELLGWFPYAMTPLRPHRRFAMFRRLLLEVLRPLTRRFQEARLRAYVIVVRRRSALRFDSKDTRRLTARSRDSQTPPQRARERFRR